MEKITKQIRDFQSKTIIFTPKPGETNWRENILVINFLEGLHFSVDDHFSFKINEVLVPFYLELQQIFEILENDLKKMSEFLNKNKDNRKALRPIAQALLSLLLCKEKTNNDQMDYNIIPFSK